MNTKNVSVGVAVVVVLVLGLVFPRSGGTVVERIVGAVPTLDGVDSGATQIGGVEVNYVRIPIQATSSTICSIPVPENATSTVLSWKANIVTGILGANKMSLSTSTNNYATSANFFIYDRNVATGVGDSFSWTSGATTTAANNLVKPLTTGESPYFLLPGERLNLRLATTTGAGALAAYYTGYCEATFLK